MAKVTISLLQSKERGEISDEHFKILTTLSEKVYKKLTKQERPSIYYQTLNDKDLAVRIISNVYDDVIEAKIYSTEVEIISQFSNSSIDFRLTPKYNVPEEKIVSKDFKKLTFA